eukprot:3224145-Lingulodinium_polyedra.AAC.1
MPCPCRDSGDGRDSGGRCDSGDRRGCRYRGCHYRGLCHGRLAAQAQAQVRIASSRPPPHP